MRHRSSLVLRLLLAAVVLGLGTAVPAGAHGSGGYPLHLATANGPLTIPQLPDRIVSLSPSATQDLYAVGAGGQVVAVDSYSTYPAKAPRTRLSGYTPNAEAIARYRPNLVVIAENIDNIVGELAKLGIPTLVEPAAANLQGAYAEIEQIGQATGHLSAASRTVARMKRQVAAILRSVPRPHPPITVYHELDQTFYTATSHSFIGQLYELLGLQNIADKVGGSNPYPQLSQEYIIASDPDLIVLADTVCCGQSLKTVAARPGWNTITAVKDGDVLPVNDSIASQWGPRIIVFLQAVAREVRTIEQQRARTASGSHGGG